MKRRHTARHTKRRRAPKVTHPIGSRVITRDGRVYHVGIATKGVKAGAFVWVQLYGPGGAELFEVEPIEPHQYLVTPKSTPKARRR